MSEFKKIGGYYVSEWNGSSLNIGTNPLTPEAHPADVPEIGGSKIIVGTGFYVGGWSNTIYKLLEGDGKVIIDAIGGRGGFFRGAGTIYNESQASRFIKFKNFSPIVLNAASVNSKFHFYDCLFDNCTFGPFGAGTEAFIGFRNIFINSPNINHTTGGFQIYNCVIENTLIGSVVVFSYCYLSKNSTLIHVGGSANLNNCCLNGKIKISGVDYELKKLFDGTTRPDADPLIPDLATASGFSDTYTTRGNFASINTKIIDFENKIVDPDSDLLKKSNATGFIGGFLPGFEVKKGDSGSNIEISTSQIDTSNPDSWVINSPTHNEGFIDFIVKIADTIVSVPKIHFDSLFAFRGNQPGGSVENNNVPDYFPANYSPLSNPGLKPNRLTYKLRTSQSILKPTIEADWDNDSATLGTTPGDFYDQEASAQPTINTVGGVRYGNANPAGFGGTSNTINARWVHLKVRLTNLRTI